MSLEKFLLMLKGGPGSGNKGHEGRPGKRGGSSSKGGTEPTPQELQWFDNLSGEEKDALFQYANAGASEINSKLRNDQDAGEVIKHLDSAISKAPKSDGNTYVYRALPPDKQPLDKGYVSAMKLEKDVEAYTNRGNIVKKILLPKGTPIAPISLIYRQWIPTADTREVILPRNIQL